MHLPVPTWDHPIDRVFVLLRAKHDRLLIIPPAHWGLRVLADGAKHFRSHFFILVFYMFR